MAKVTVCNAVIELGLSERRVRQLAGSGRVRGATKAGAEWLIPKPVGLVSGKLGPAGVAGPRTLGPTP